MRLIDADGVMEEIKRNKLLAREPAAERCMDIIKNATTYVQPTAHDVDKVVERLEKLPTCSNWNHNSNNIDRKQAIEIVKECGVNE